MKKLFFTFCFIVGLFTSCVENPVEDPDPLPPPGHLTADFDGSVYTSTVEQVVITDVSMSIKASREDGSFFRITLPERPIIGGTYTWAAYDLGSPGFFMAYYENADAVPYVAARDNSGEFANFSNYTDTAEIVILGIDTTNKRVSGTFKFTGVRFADDTQLTVETKVFTNGTFFNMPYSSTPVLDPDDDDSIFPTRIVSSFPGTSTDDQSSVFTYNGNKILKETHTDSEGLIETTEYTYTGNLITKVEIKSNNVVEKREVFQYDSSNKLVTYVASDLLQSTAIRETYIHNADGSISVTRFTGDLISQTTPDGTSTISFENGEIAEISFSSGSVKSYTYDSNKNPFKNVLGFNKISFVDGEARGIVKNIVRASVDAVTLYNFSYTYTPYNFPLKATSTGIVIDFFYE